MLISRAQNTDFSKDQHKCALLSSSSLLLTFTVSWGIGHSQDHEFQLRPKNHNLNHFCTVLLEKYQLLSRRETSSTEVEIGHGPTKAIIFNNIITEPHLKFFEDRMTDRQSGV